MTSSSDKSYSVLIVKREYAIRATRRNIMLGIIVMIFNLGATKRDDGIVWRSLEEDKWYLEGGLAQRFIGLKMTFKYKVFFNISRKPYSLT